MENGPLQDIDGEIKSIREKMRSATDSIDRRNFLLALQMLTAERTRRLNEDSEP
jgi:hypothetical protein